MNGCRVFIGKAKSHKNEWQNINPYLYRDLKKYDIVKYSRVYFFVCIGGLIYISTLTLS